MNSNQPPRNPLPQLNNLADARVFLDTIRTDLSCAWNGVEHTIKFLTEALQEKTNNINTLRRNLTAYENALNEKTTRILQMEQVLTRMQGQIQEKDYSNQQKEFSIEEKESLIQQFISWNKQMQAKITSCEENMQVLSRENADLKTKLSQLEGQSVAELQGLKLTEQHQKTLSAAISRELAQRADLINTKAKEAVIQHVSKYQRRVMELEEQLRLLKAKMGVDHNINPPVSSDQIEGRQGEINPHSNPPKDAMITAPSLSDPNKPHQQSDVPAPTTGYSSSCDVASFFTQQ